MNNIFTYCLYIITIGLLGVSLIRDKNKTKLALKKAWMMFINVLPQFSAIILLMGFLLAVFDENTIKNVIGPGTGILGILAASFVGSIALVPALAAFPVAAELLGSGAGLLQITVFISTLTTVGLVTLSLERKYLGMKAAVLRNGLFYLFAFFVAFVMERVLL